MRIAVLLIATSRYRELLPRAVDSIKKRFLSDCERDIFVWSDAPPGSFSDCALIPWPHQPWPKVTLRRYHAFALLEDRLRTYDHIFYLDVDMNVAQPVGAEICGQLVAAQHPYQSLLSRDRRTYERREASRAFVAAGEGDDYYYGGFQGGSGNTYMDAVCEMKRMIDHDLDAGIIPLWHDESIWNRYLIDNPPDVILSPSYAYPEGQRLPYEMKIIALNKDHESIRAEGRGSFSVTGDPPRQNGEDDAPTGMGRGMIPVRLKGGLGNHLLQYAGPASVVQQARLPLRLEANLVGDFDGGRITARSLPLVSGALLPTPQWRRRSKLDRVFD